MPCGCHWSRHWWSTVTGGPDLGGSDCGQQVSGALSVYIITHFLHEVIYLATTAQRGTRGLTARVSSYISTRFGHDGLWICEDLAVNTANTSRQVNIYCAVISIRHDATRDKVHRKKQELLLSNTPVPPLVQLSELFVELDMSDCMQTKQRTMEVCVFKLFVQSEQITEFS